VLVSRVQAIEWARRGEVYSRPGVAGTAAEAWPTPTHAADALSVREQRVLQLIANSNAGMASPCGASG
jgi:DNA-binding NarL/FixJ family response regulator